MTQMMKLVDKSIKIVIRKFLMFKNLEEGFTGGTVVESPPASAGDMGSIPGLGGSHMLQSN